MKKAALVFLFSTLISFGARAQFDLEGNERGSLKWETISTPSYQFIFPAGTDSLARCYARAWEGARAAVGASIGYLPNSTYKKPLPVVLHPRLAYANGMVAWLPRGMEMYTGPQMYSPLPYPWLQHLALHENRHVSQTDFSNRGFFKGFSWLTGDIGHAFWDLAFFNSAFYEGDAVVTETALTESGRGRNAAFLEYYRASYAEGKSRDIYQWRYGSARYYTPDYYRAGYLAVGGIRTVFDRPDFASYTYDRLFTKGSHGKLNNFHRSVREQTGMKLKDAFAVVMDTIQRRWAADDSLRGPFQPFEEITKTDRYFTGWVDLEETPVGLFAVRSGMTRNTELVRLDADGRILERRVVSSTGSKLISSPYDGRLYRTEYRGNIRWEMESTSELRYLGENLRFETLAGDGRFYNPAPHPAKPLVAVCENPWNGRSLITLIDSRTGERIKSLQMPDGLQAVEPVWAGNDLYVSAVNLEGQGIWRIGRADEEKNTLLEENNGFFAVLRPSPVTVNGLFSKDGKIYFVSDRSGVEELYCLDGRKVCQVSNLRQGGNNFLFFGDYLYFTYLKPDGRVICRTTLDSLNVRPVNFEERHRYQMAEELSAQEALRPFAEDADSLISGVSKYNRLANAFHLHSWLPIYVDYDEISSMSFETVWSVAAPGATAFFQNRLGNFAATAAYSYSPVDEYGWGSGGHAKLSYYGLPVVLNASFNINRLGPYGYFQGYLPLNLSRNGWSKGIVPKATAIYNPADGWYWNAGVRAYSSLPVTTGRIYPKYGIGAELGISMNAPYGTAYVYLPGIGQTHGIRCACNYDGWKNLFDFDVRYSMPVFRVDWSGLSPFVYVRNFELIPEYEWMYGWTDKAEADVHVFGAAFNMVLGNFAFVDYDIHAGAKFLYCPSSGKYTIGFNLSLDI